MLASWFTRYSRDALARSWADKRGDKNSAEHTNPLFAAVRGLCAGTESLSLGRGGCPTITAASNTAYLWLH